MVDQQGEILKVGFLRKKGHVRRNWLDRWFVLTTEGFYYYKNRTDPKPTGVIPLFGCGAREEAGKHQHVFICSTAEGKEYPIQACTKDEMLVWIKAIDDARSERNKRPPDSSAPTSQNPAIVKHVEPQPKKRVSRGSDDSDDDDDND